MGFLTPAHYSVSKKKASGGYLLLEAVISMAIFGGLLMFITMSFRNVFSSQAVSTERVTAGLYAQEGMEVMYNLATNSTNWINFISNFEPTTSYYPVFTSGTQLGVGEELLDGKYTRRIYIRTVVRDPITFQVVPDGTPGAVEDEGTLRVITNVSWEVEGQPQEIQYETYLIAQGEE